MVRPRSLGLIACAVLAVAVAAAVRADPDAPALLVPPALGRTDVVWIFGRVLEEERGQSGPPALRTARALAGSNRPGAAVTVRFLGRTARTVSAHDGEFEAVISSARRSPFPPGRHLAEVVVEGVRARAAVQVVSPEAPFLLVSDFDDTVAITGATSTADVLTSTFLRDAETQPTVPGMAALYRCLGTNAGAPVAFVSGSPVQLAPRLTRFLEKNGFPHAALYLRNLGPDTLSRYKEPVLERLAERFPGLRLVLVGDTGERDPEVYAAFARAHPGRVLRAYLRQATPTPGPASRFEGQLLFQEPAQAARDAVARGLADPRCVETAFPKP